MQLGSEFKVFMTALVTTMALGFGCNQAQATDPRAFAALYSMDQIQADPSLEFLHFEALKTRFENNDFSEVLFSDSNSIGPRLSMMDHAEMFRALRSFFNRPSVRAEIPDVQAYLRDRPAFESFLVDYKKEQASVRSLPLQPSRFGLFLKEIALRESQSDWLLSLDPADAEFMLKLVKAKDPRVLKAQDLSLAAILRSEGRAGYVLSSWGALYRSHQSEQILRSAAEFLVRYWLGRNHLGTNVRLDELSNLDQIYLRSSFEREIKELIQTYSLPGKLSHNFFAYTNLDRLAEPSIPREGTLVVPMSRWEALFKGIGPGECIRTSCNRFFDALYPESLAFAVLQEGKELGYIGIYRVWERDGHRPFWYIDTIQSPGLVSAGGGHKILDQVLSQLARFALREGAQLAVANSNFNAINFRENVSVLQTLGMQESIGVAFEDSSLFDEIEDFVADPEQSHHQDWMARSGYRAGRKKIYDSLALNSYQVRVLEPPNDFNESELNQVLALRGYSPLTERQKNPKSPLTKLKALKFLGDGPSMSFRRFKIYQGSQLYFRNSEASKTALPNILFPVLSESILNFDYRVPAAWASLFNGLPAADRLQALGELLMLSDNRSLDLDLIQTLGSKDIAFGQWVVQFAIPLLSSRGFKDWASLYKIIQNFAADDFVQMSFSFEIAARLESPDEYLRFVHVNQDETDPLLTRLLIARSPHYLQQFSDFGEAVAFSGQLIESMRGRAGLNVRKSLLRRSSSLKQILQVVNIGIPPAPVSNSEYQAEIARTVSRVGIQEKDDLDRFTSLTPQLSVTSQAELILQTVVPGLRRIEGVKWIKVYRDFLPRMNSDNQDARLARLILENNPQVNLRDFVRASVSFFRPGELGNSKLRAQIFAQMVTERMSKVTNDSSRRALMLSVFNDWKRANFDLAVFMQELREPEVRSLVPAAALLAGFGSARSASEQSALAPWIKALPPELLKDLRQNGPGHFLARLTMGLLQDPVTRGLAKWEKWQNSPCASELAEMDQ